MKRTGILIAVIAVLLAITVILGIRVAQLSDPTQPQELSQLPTDPGGAPALPQGGKIPVAPEGQQPPAFPENGQLPSDMPQPPQWQEGSAPDQPPAGETPVPPGDIPAEPPTAAPTQAVTEPEGTASETSPSQAATDPPTDPATDSPTDPVVQTDPTVNTTDTSDMDFEFDEEDLQTDPPTDAPTQSATQPENPTKITAGGTYTLSGTITDTMIVIDADDADVTLILDGVTLQNSKGPAIFVRSAGKVTLTLAEGTVNTLSDGNSYSVTDSGSTLDAVIFSKADLTVNGGGTLKLTGNYKHGIVSKDDLVISSGTLQIQAQNVGLNGKDCVKINGGSVTVRAGTDGIRSDNTEDSSKGFIYLYGGTVNITSGNDGIQAQTVIKIDGVKLTVTAGGGSSGSLSSSEESYKGIKAGSDIYISGGTFTLNTLDDCIHSNGTVTIKGGSYTLSSGDDGIHADTDLAISGSSTKLTVKKSYEGIEATNIVISGGRITVTASDDGINAAGGNDSSSSGRPGQNNFTGSSGSIVISGGTIKIYMSGDGIDSNGTLSVTGGSITICGPTSGDTSILDYDSSAAISGGTFVGTGAAGMTQNFGSSSTQGSVMIKTSGSAGTVITLTDSAGNTLLTYTAEKSFACIILSHPSLVKGERYTLTVGSAQTDFTMSSTAQTLGSSGSSGGPGGRK